MNKERWQQITELFEAALERPASDRTAFLDEACGADPSIREEIAALLAADGQSGRFLDTPPAKLVRRPVARRTASSPTAVSEVTYPAVGDVLGSYRLVQEIGAGGMSVVYLSVRADDEFRQQVAIKVFLRGRAHLFRTERQILAGLDHPHVAKLLDGGTTDQGLPYFVMEYIDGIPIDRYCVQHRLSVDQRLELFRKVCAAVHYAHQNLVVHRDIKPGNILVRVDGVPKLLDFGIAKLLNPALLACDEDGATLASRVMTPSYASPEQLRGESISTASDVYSLGVLLHKLLTDRLPRSPSNPDAEPIPPSRAVSAGDRDEAWTQSTKKLRRRLAGDLDSIVLKAMHFDPLLRYASAEQLSEDLRRHQASFPVLARPATRSYRLEKFIGRHRLGVAAALAVLGILIGFAAVVWWQSVRILEERDRARQVAGLLEEILKVSDPQQAGDDTITVRELLDRGAAKVRWELRDQPDIQAALMNTVGDVYADLGLYDQGRQLVETALETRRRLFGNRHPAVIESLHTLGQILFQQEQFQASELAFREALHLTGEIDDPRSTHRGHLFIGLGQVSSERGDMGAAQDHYRRALESFRQTHGTRHREAARALELLGTSLAASGSYAEADSLLQEALEIQRRVLGEHHPDIVHTLNSRANILYWQGDYATAEPLYRQALEILRRSLRDEHPLLAAHLANLGGLLFTTGRLDEAEALYREALAIQRKAPRGHRALAYMLNTLALVLDAKGESVLAEELYREALAIQGKLFGEEHPDVGYTFNNLASLLFKRGDYEAAEPLHRRALEIWRKTFGEEHRQVAAALYGLGRLLVETGEHGEAEAMLRECTAMLERLLPQGHWRIAQAESTLGAALTAAGRYSEAEPLLVAAYATLRRARGESKAETREAYRYLIELYDAWQKPERIARYRPPPPAPAAPN